MIHLEGFTVAKEPIELDHNDRPIKWHWSVRSTGDQVASCDTEEESEIFIGMVRLRAAVHNNTKGRK